MKKILILISIVVSIFNSQAQNVGIGTPTPAHKLDIAGRVRVQHTTNNTAGIWLDGTTLPTRSFIGTINDDHVGIFGNAGANWNIAMNVENGNTGIGTSTPTARLDINGTLRIRSSLPKKGSVLTSNDADGNASWMDPVAFRAWGLPGGNNVNIPNGEWSKIMFHTTPSYNHGLNYQPFLSQFLVAEKGIYHFNTQLSFHYDNLAHSQNARIRVNRNGNFFDIAYYSKGWGIGLEAHELVRLPATINISTDAQLEVGDIVFVEARLNEVVNQFYVNLANSTLYGGGTETWFAGHLVTRL